MKRTLLFLTGTSVALILLAPPKTEAQGTGNTAQPNSNAFGKSLTEWMKLYVEWGFGVTDQSAFGKVLPLPIPSSTVVSGSYTYADPAIRVSPVPAEVSLKTGQPFVITVIYWYGESYIPGLYSADEDPNLPIEIFLNPDATTRVTITRVANGRTEVVMDSDLASVEPFYFDTPLDIVYDEPSAYGSTGAIFAQGIGFVHGPMPPGQYVMQLKSTLLIPPDPEYLLLDEPLGYTNGVGVEYNNTWNITVTPGKK